MSKNSTKSTIFRRCWLKSTSLILVILQGSSNSWWCHFSWLVELDPRGGFLEIRRSGDLWCLEVLRVFFVHGWCSCFLFTYRKFLIRNMFDCYWMFLMDFNHLRYCILKCLECVTYSALMLDFKCAKTTRVWHDCQSYMPFCMKRKWWIMLYLDIIPSLFFLERIMMFYRQLERRCLHFFGRQRNVICGDDIPWFTNWEDWNHGKLHPRVWTELILSSLELFCQPNVVVDRSIGRNISWSWRVGLRTWNIWK